jgi:phenylpropionate dioxygenase-like ring-hydroxylating dioxygenase large terminal subunit
MYFRLRVGGSAVTSIGSSLGNATMMVRLMTWLTFWRLVTPSFSFSFITPLTIRHQTLMNRHYVALSSSYVEEAVKSDVEEGIGAWIPIASAHALKGLGPQRIRVMGIDLVVWEGETLSVMRDACPHRLAPLSQGRVDPETKCIECPYHGWQFDANGTLMKLPQLDSNRTLESVKGGHAESLPVHKVGDMIYAFLPSSVHGEMFPQSLMPEDMYPTLREEVARNCTYFTRELPYSADFLIENFMDPAHIPFAHHSLQSVRSDGGEIPMSVLTSNFTHVECTFKDQSRGRQRECV